MQQLALLDIEATRLRLPRPASPETASINFVGRQYHRHVREIFAAWRMLNEWLFEDGLREPVVFIGTTRAKGRTLAGQTSLSGLYADTIAMLFHGGLFIGRHPDLGYPPRSYSISDLRRRYWLGTLLHEMIHQREVETTGAMSDHGALFADKAREIGDRLGLLPWGNAVTWPGNGWKDLAILDRALPRFA